jgi:hypothetical protein
LGPLEIKSSTGVILLLLQARIITALAFVMITTAPLSSWRTSWWTSWVHKLFTRIRKFKLLAAEEGRMIRKEKNQFGIGEINNLAIVLSLCHALGTFLQLWIGA